MTQRDQRIDVLRGISIILVLLHHFHLAYHLGTGLLFSNGNYAVIVFFAISGYLITSTSLRRFGRLGQVSPARFYAFRFARIYPCLVLVLLAINIPGIFGVRYFASTKPVSWLLADFSVLTFWHNVLMAHYGWFNYGMNVLWSLSVEEVFYLLFPLLCLLLRRDWMLLTVWAVAICYAPLYRSQHATDEMQFLYSDFSCFDAIAMGCSAALLARHNAIDRRIRNGLQLAALLAMLAIFFSAGIWDNVIWGPTLMATGTALFLWAEACQPSQSAVMIRPLAWFGSHSYELYLFHIVVLAAMRNSFDRNKLPVTYQWPWFAAYVALSCLVASAISRWYSEPLNRTLRERLASQPPSSLAAASAS